MEEDVFFTKDLFLLFTTTILFVSCNCFLFFELVIVVVGLSFFVLFFFDLVLEDLSIILLRSCAIASDVFKANANAKNKNTLIEVLIITENFILKYCLLLFIGRVCCRRGMPYYLKTVKTHCIPKYESRKPKIYSIVTFFTKDFKIFP